MESILRGVKRIFWELVKILPLILFIAGTVYYMGDYSQIQMAVYFLAVITLVIAVFQVVRKFLFPEFSLQEHMHQVKNHSNMASAVLLVGSMLFMFGICYLMVWLMMASVK